MPYKCKLKADVLLRWARDCPDISPVERLWLQQMCRGQRTGYRGRGEFLRDYHPLRQLTTRAHMDENQKRFEKVQIRIREGKVAGPFERPPFPDKACVHQAIVQKEFGIPKSKHM